MEILEIVATPASPGTRRRCHRSRTRLYRLHGGDGHFMAGGNPAGDPSLYCRGAKHEADDS
jgi:hypothetical protein